MDLSDQNLSTYIDKNSRELVQFKSPFKINMREYSSKTLREKLGLKDGLKVRILHPPEQYATWVNLEAETENGNDFDFIHLFTNDPIELELSLLEWKNRIKKTGVIWVSWYKKSSKLPSGITEDEIRRIALPMGLVDVKVCAVNEIWSGLKLVWRKDFR